LFLEDQKPATASIVVSLRGSGRLASLQVKGITHLVSSAVEGLSHNNITILDNKGSILYKGEDENSMFALSSNQLDLQRKVENYLAKKAQSMLDSIIGVSNAIVKVTARLNFEQIEKTEERFDPETVVRSETITEESSSGKSTGPGGVVGTDANLEEGAKSSGQETSNEKNKTITQTNYEIGRTVQKIIKEIGDITRLNVAVFVKQRTIKDEKGEEIKVPGDAEILEYNGIVKQAVGFDAERGDKVDIKAVPYETYELLNEQERDMELKMIKSESRALVISQIVKYGFIALFLVILLVLSKGVLSSMGITSKKEEEKQEKEGSQIDVTVGGIEGEIGAEPSAETEEDDFGLISKLPPDIVVNVIKSWLKE